MTNPDLPPDSITTLPREQRTAAVRERYNALAYSGLTAADRERDTVIGHLLDESERAEQDLAALREVVAKMQPAVQAVWNFLIAQIMPAWRAVEPILAALDGEDDRPGGIPERERLVHDDPALAAQIREGVAEAERGESVDRGSFAQHLDEGGGDD